MRVPSVPLLRRSFSLLRKYHAPSQYIISSACTFYLDTLGNSESICSIHLPQHLG